MRLRKKPVEIEGFQMTAPRMRTRSFDDWPEWAVSAAVDSTDCYDVALYRTTEMTWYVHTLEGIVRVSVDDWILRGVKGELYPCKPDVLALTYDVLGPDRDGT